MVPENDRSKVISFRLSSDEVELLELYRLQGGLGSLHAAAREVLLEQLQGERVEELELLRSQLARALALTAKNIHPGIDARRLLEGLRQELEC